MPAILGGRLVNVPDEVDPLLCQITWADGLGAITHILGPTDQPLVISPGSGQKGNFIGSLLVGAAASVQEGTLHVHTASAGAVTASGAADDLIVENSGNAGISILSPAASASALYFGCPTDTSAAYVEWSQSTLLFKLGSSTTSGQVQIVTGNGVDAIRVNSTGQVGIGTSTPTAGYLLDVTGGTSGIRGVGTTGYGGYFTSTSGTGCYGSSSSSYGLLGLSTTGVALRTIIEPATTNTVAEVCSFQRSTSGAAANGIGGFLGLYTEHSGGSAEESCKIAWALTDAGNGTEDSFLAFYTRHGGDAAAEAVRIDDLKNICIGVTTQDASLANGILMANGTAPTGVANTAGFYADSGDMYVFDAAGAATLLSPHDEDGNWIFLSRDLKTGRVLTIEVEKLMRALNEFFGTDYVHDLAGAA